YGLLRFVFDDVVTLHFIHLYAVLFVIEVGIMLACGALAPREQAWEFTRNEQVDMTPWRFAKPLAVTLFSCVVATYLLFSPLGVASEAGPEMLFGVLVSAIGLLNVAVWSLAARRPV
ncbi:MAG: solute:sodium symporter family transporter, partial [Pseudomonadota bacterium]